jgi:hypothetical protein
VIKDQLIASGINMNVLPLTTLINLVRTHAPRINNSTGSSCQIWVVPKGGEFYYENIYFAAKSGNKTLVRLFVDTCYKMSTEQIEEVESIIGSY